MSLVKNVIVGEIKINQRKAYYLTHCMDPGQTSASRETRDGSDASVSPTPYAVSSSFQAAKSHHHVSNVESDKEEEKEVTNKTATENQQPISLVDENKVNLFAVKLEDIPHSSVFEEQFNMAASSSSNTFATVDNERIPPLNKMVYLDEFEEVAKKKLDNKIFDYYGQGADEEKTLKWNRTMISHKYCLKPRVMRDVSRVDLTKYIFGDKLALPIGISPTAMQKMANSSGEIGMVRACNQMNSLMILSFFSTTSLEDVAKAAPICTKWQNIYIVKNREITQNLINRAIRYGYRALVVTCDAPVLGNRRRDLKNTFTLGQFTLENIDDPSVKSMREHSSEIFDPSVTWQDLADLKKSVGDTIRVIAKGIMTPEDAELAIQAGVDAIFISNHGGRQLDGAQATIEVLPAIVKVVAKRCPVFVDGGFRTGADILVALALGADMVFVGRPPLWGLASYGEEGAYAVLRILQDELRRAMMLCGCNKLSDINKNIVLERR